MERHLEASPSGVGVVCIKVEHDWHDLLETDHLQCLWMQYICLMSATESERQESWCVGRWLRKATVGIHTSCWGIHYHNSCGQEWLYSDTYNCGLQYHYNRSKSCPDGTCIKQPSGIVEFITYHCPASTSHSSPCKWKLLHTELWSTGLRELHINKWCLWGEQ